MNLLRRYSVSCLLISFLSLCQKSRISWQPRSAINGVGMSPFDRNCSFWTSAISTLGQTSSNSEQPASVPLATMGIDELRLELPRVKANLESAFTNQDAPAVAKWFRKKEWIENKIGLLERGGLSTSEQELREPMNIGTNEEPFVIRKFVSTTLKAALTTGRDSQSVSCKSH